MTSRDDESPTALSATLRGAGIAGGAGFLFGGTAGILTSPTPALWAAAATFQWALLGGTYWGLRTAVINNTQIESEMTSTRLTWISSICGGLTFAAIGAVTRGRQNVIPGTVMGSIICGSGQAFINTARERQNLPPDANQNKMTLWQRTLAHKWSPVKFVPNEKYVEVLKGKIAEADAEIAAVDEKIATLKRRQEEEDRGSAQDR